MLKPHFGFIFGPKPRGLFLVDRLMLLQRQVAFPVPLGDLLCHLVPLPKHVKLMISLLLNPARVYLVRLSSC